MTKAERRNAIAKRARARKVSEDQRRRWARIKRAQAERVGDAVAGGPWDDVMDVLERLG